jgi:RNA polymerase sigma-70 factor, ECF subfamily
LVASKRGSAVNVGTIDRSELTRLMSRVAQMDRAAFVSLYAATSAKPYVIVFRILRHRRLTDDVPQEVYVRIWNKAADFEAARFSPITWMATIARNRAPDEVRKPSHGSIVELTEVLQIAGEALARDVRTVEEDGRRLQDCLQRLDPEKREIVVRYLSAASVANICFTNTPHRF